MLSKAKLSLQDSYFLSCCTEQFDPLHGSVAGQNTQGGCEPSAQVSGTIHGGCESSAQISGTIHGGCESSAQVSGIIHGGCEPFAQTSGTTHGGCEPSAQISGTIHGGCESSAQVSGIIHGGCEPSVQVSGTIHGGCEPFAQTSGTTHGGCEPSAQISGAIHGGSELSAHNELSHELKQGKSRPLFESHARTKQPIQNSSTSEKSIIKKKRKYLSFSNVLFKSVFSLFLLESALCLSKSSLSILHHMVYFEVGAQNHFAK
ncbi:hypothetical protein M0C34_15960 [Agarivorans sp. TSD2052]|uniref:hypothetical protein n=1 Tax=Agarivorans sp. TSD2052 TaxID=2937286 RepID=UPI00200F07AF|nr:hypothetical protein [Agarivorans sp. TSD2052]UPW17723.1 hypothetical protein M0C34_15960 [Agarivorans sp. TSD2052]